MMGNVVSTRRTLSAISPLDALHQALSTESNLDPRDKAGWLSDTGSDWPSVIEGGQISAAAFSPTCASQPAPDLHMFQTASGLALGTTGAAVGILGPSGGALIPAAAVPVIGWAIAGVGVLVGVIGTIFAHHAAAAKQEQQLGCAAISAFNNSLSLIDQGVNSGQIPPDVAEGALDHLESQVENYMAASIKHNPCNADCEVLLQVKAIVNYKKSVYADLAAAGTSAAPPTPMVVPSTAGAPPQQYSGGPAPRVSVQSAGVSSAGGWFDQNKWLIAGGLALFLLMEAR